MSLITAMIKTRRADGYSRNKLAQVQQARLKKLVDYARKNSPFYKDRYSNISDAFRLEDLPPVTKPELMRNFDRVMTDCEVSMRAVDAFCTDLDNVGRMLNGKYLVFKTSGSTGNPAVVLYDKQCMKNGFFMGRSGNDFS